MGRTLIWSPPVAEKKKEKRGGKVRGTVDINVTVVKRHRRWENVAASGPSTMDTTLLFLTYQRMSTRESRGPHSFDES